jgi:hypothetical protein
VEIAISVKEMIRNRCPDFKRLFENFLQSLDKWPWFSLGEAIDQKVMKVQFSEIPPFTLEFHFHFVIFSGTA